jgi:glycolate oxidase FAD binding subunit
VKIDSEILASKLQSELGTEAVTLDSRVLSRYTVDGENPAVVCFPSTPDQVGTALRLCSEAEAAVTPWGGGTAMALGNIPRSVEVVIALDRLDKLIEHDDANLTATAQAGMTLSALQEQLKQSNQFLALDPPQPDRATIGGVVAANMNGPRRMLHGSVRDLVIGMRVVLATGEQIKAGGKVVKNVAGYDLCKLFVGSLGTLGIITEVTFKMAPLAETAGTLIAQGSLADCIKMVEEISSSTLLPPAVTLFNAAAAKAEGFETEAAAVAVWTDGFTEAVERHLLDFQSIAERIGLATETLRSHQHAGFWQQVCNFGAGREIVLYRLTVPLGSVSAVLVALDQRSAASAATQIVAHAGSGTILVQTQADIPDIAWFSKLTEMANQHHGHAVVLAAPSALKKDLDVWGPSPPSLNIMRKIKHQFDPHGILNPGRFIAKL